MKDFPTSSTMPRLAACAPSDALTAIGGSGRPAIVGSAKHDHMYDRAAFGVDEAMARLLAVAERWHLDEKETRIFIAQMRKFTWSPPKHAFGEVALAMREDGTVYRTRGGRGRYDETEPGTILAGQNDIMWSEPEPLDLSDPAHPKCPPGSRLWVGDYKAGDEVHVEAVEENAQIAANAVMAAKWTGATSVVPFVLFLHGEEGVWDAPMEAWDEVAIAAADARVQEIIRRRREQLARARAGAPLEGFVEGAWCTFCPGRDACPAKVAMMRSVAAQAQVGPQIGPLSAEQLQWWALRLTQIDALAKKAREYLKTYVDEHGPIPLGHGREWGATSTTSAMGRVKAVVALPIVAAEIGRERAEAILEMSKSAIEEAVKESLEEQGIKRQGAPTMRRLLGQIAGAGGFESVTRVTYGARVVEEEAESPELEEAS